MPTTRIDDEIVRAANMKPPEKVGAVAAASVTLQAC